MKKIIIGSTFIISGTIMNAAMLISTSIYSTKLDLGFNINFWNALYGETINLNGQDTYIGMGLGFLFVLSIIIFCVGIIFFIDELVHVLYKFWKSRSQKKVNQSS